MSFICELRAIQEKQRTDISQSQLIMNEILNRTSLSSQPFDVQYEHIYDILAARDALHGEILDAGLKEDVKVTGSVTELICKIALDAAAPMRYHKLPKTWDWIGDFAIMGSPFNLFVSVKSYKAKERLIVSGTGQNAAPVVGYGLFNDENEWSPDRIKQYKQRGFIAIYMPEQLYNNLATKNSSNPDLSQDQIKKYSKTNGYPATDLLNIYDRPLLRKIDRFAFDIKQVCIPNDYTLDLSRY